MGLAGVTALGVALVYVVLSRSDPGVVGAGTSAPDLGSSLTRYYWPIYIGLPLGAGVALAAMGRSLSQALLAGLLLLAGYTIWISPQESVTAWQRLVTEQRDRFVPLFEATTEPEAVICSGNIDKGIVGSRRVISFWQEGSETYQARSMMDPARVAVDAATIHAAGFPVYFLVRPANAEDIGALEAPLATAGLGLAWGDRFARGLDLWRVEPLPDGSAAHRLSPDAVALTMP